MGRDGVILIDKPGGITSRRALDRVLRILRTKRGGHFGSLDPFATGLLCIGVGQGTKLLPFLQDHPKEYVAEIGFEKSTDTDDCTGQTLAAFPEVVLDKERIQAWIDDHTGWIEQTPPVYCAQKLNGTPLYRLKRAQHDVTPRAKQVFIEQASVIAYGPDGIELRVVCSRGTYIRSIARDLGAALGYGGYLRALRRFRSEGFSLEEALSLEELEAKVAGGTFREIPLAQALHLPTSRVTRVCQADIQEGKPVQIAGVIERPDAPEDSLIGLVDEDERLLCVARVRRQGGIFGYIERGFQPF